MRNYSIFKAVSTSLLMAGLTVGLTVGCASTKSTHGNSRNSSGVVKTAQVLELEKKVKAREEISQDSKDRNRVLKRKAAMSPSTVADVAAPMTAAPSAAPNSAATMQPVAVPAQLSKLSDRDLYAEMIKAYDLNNEIAFFSKYNAFMAKYANSPLADEAIYLAGLMSLSNRNYGPSLKYFNLILSKYSMSNKASLALYAKGAALKKMNLLQESKEAFNLVLQKYPGSPESMRAEAEVKILNR
jgi:TolA-binding protein